MLGVILKMSVFNHLIVGVRSFEDVIELEVGWQVVEAAERGGLVYGC